MKYIVANWKQNKTIPQAIEWLKSFKQADVPDLSDIKIIIAAPFTLLPDMKKYIDAESLPVSLGAQDISPKSEGAYTGEVGGPQLKELVEYVIIGHSERRMYFGETNQFVSLKVEQALAHGITPFVCIADQVFEDGRVPRSKIDVSPQWFSSQIETVFAQVANKTDVVLVYEPILAISTFGGQPLTGEEARTALQGVKSIAGESVLVMYGGSVNKDNIKEYWTSDVVAGGMPGAASLEVDSFVGLLRAALV